MAAAGGYGGQQTRAGAAPAAAQAQADAANIDAAEEALLDAVQQGSIQEIREALRRAEEIGVDEEMITLARDTLNSRVEHATLSAQAHVMPAAATANAGATPTTASTTPEEADPELEVQQCLARLEEASAGD